MLVIPVHKMVVLPHAVTYMRADAFAKSTGRAAAAGEKVILLLTKDATERSKLTSDSFQPLAVTGTVQEGVVNGFLGIKTLDRVGVDDADVMKCIRMLTFLPLEQIDEMDAWEGSQLNQAKEILAYELTALVHGEEEAKKAQEGAKALFGGGANSANIPTAILTPEMFTDGSIDLISVLVNSGLVTSRSEGRRAIEQGGVSVDDEKITDIKAVLPEEKFDGEGILVKRGKKNFRRVHK